jgi:hypothetical protein
LAPRSCPSSPGFAINTRSFRSGRGLPFNAEGAEENGEIAETEENC